MATYYVGKGGNDGNAGTSWATRKLTLNGAEDIPVAAGDTVIVGPGTYREELTIDVTGTVGNPITYEGDRTGRRTDGVGGQVIITGSDDDIVKNRDHCIDSVLAGGHHYRTWRNLIMGQTSDAIVYIETVGTESDGWVFEDCTFYGTSSHGVEFDITGDDNTFRRCVFLGVQYCIRTTSGSLGTGTGNVVESCLFATGNNGDTGLYIYSGEWTVRNCTFIGLYRAIDAKYDNSGTPYIWLYNSLIMSCRYGLAAVSLGDLVEDYNGFHHYYDDRDGQVAVGANSEFYAPLWESPLLQEGIESTVRFPFLSQWSPYRRLTDNGTVPAGGDLFGLPFPATNGKRSWGCIQYQPFERDGSVYRGASGASGKMADAGPKTFLVPASASSTTLEVYARRGANYAGSNPRVVIRQPGQSEIEVVDSGAAGAWNLITHTWTPAASPPWAQVMLESRNTAGAGDYTVNWDDLKVEVDT